MSFAIYINPMFDKNEYRTAIEMHDAVTYGKNDPYMIFKKHFQKFLKKHPKARKVDYIGIKTNYLDRILSSKERMDMINADAIYGDKLPNGQYIVPPYKNDAFLDSDKMHNKDGVCYFLSSDPMKLFEYINRLLFTPFPFYEILRKIEWFKQDDQVVMMGYLDSTYI